MSDDRRRLRRPNPQSGRRSSQGGGPGSAWSWLITIAAAIAVIAGGWFLGQALAHMFGARSSTQTVAAQPSGIPAVTPLPSPESTVLAVSPVPSPTQAPTSPPSPKPTPPPRTPEPAVTAAPTAVPTSMPVPTATPMPAEAPTVSPAPPPALAPARKPSIAPSRQPPASSAAPAPASAGNAATETVRAYIAALMRGDPQSAAGYLGNGSPDESFITASTRIRSITETPNPDGSAKVEVDMQTSQGEYFETFQVASSAGGSRILDKTAIKP